MKIVRLLLTVSINGLNEGCVMRFVEGTCCEDVLLCKYLGDDVIIRRLADEEAPKVYLSDQSDPLGWDDYAGGPLLITVKSSTPFSVWGHHIIRYDQKNGYCEEFHYAHSLMKDLVMVPWNMFDKRLMMIF